MGVGGPPRTEGGYFLEPHGEDIFHVRTRLGTAGREEGRLDRAVIRGRGEEAAK